MTRKSYWLAGLGIVVALMVAIAGQPVTSSIGFIAFPPTLAQSSPSPTPTDPPASAPATLPPPPPVPTAPPASTAPPLPIEGYYQDTAGRFKVGILKGYKVSPLAGSVLVESPDGNLAYSVVAQSQPTGNPIGLVPGSNSDSLARVATTVFQRGEGFQPGPPAPEAGGGVVINWTGTLTIGGNSQPVGGVILVRPDPKTILLLLVTATQAGAGQVPGAVSALASSLQSL